MKIEKLVQHWEPELPLLCCPKCGAEFTLESGQLRCQSGHCYDLSAKGYVNLTPNHDQKKEKYDAALFELLRDACIKRGIPWQTKTRVAGGTDAGRIHRSRAGVRVCAAAAPVRYIHSPSSVAAKADCEAVLAAARAFLEELGGDDE